MIGAGLQKDVMPRTVHAAAVAGIRARDPRGGKVRFSPMRLQIRPGKFREPDPLLLLSSAEPRCQNYSRLGG